MQIIFDLGKTKKLKLNKLKFAFIIAGFFIARVIVFKFLSPFIIAYLSLFLGSIDFYFLSLIMLIGLFSKLSGVYFSRYLIAIFFMGLVNIFVNKKKLFVKALSGFLFLFLSSLIIFFVVDKNNFLLLTNFFESMLVFCMAYVFSPVKEIFFDKKKLEINNDYLICFGIIFSGIICGMSDIYFADILLVNIIIFLCLLLIGKKYGSSYACMFGLILGVILNLTGIIDINKIIFLSLFGVLSGLLKKNKLINLILINFVSPIIIYYFCLDLMNKNFFVEIMIAEVLFLILPEGKAKKENTSEEYINNIKSIIRLRLKSFSAAFKKLALTFDNLSRKKSGFDRKDIEKLIDCIANKSCNNCGMRDFCWKNNFYATYQSVFGILNSCEKKGFVDINSISSDFRLNCVNLNKFIDNANKLFEIYKINLKWSNKMIESRELVSQQLAGVANIINNLASELDLNINFDNELEEKILNELSKNNISFESITASKNKNGRYEIIVDIKSCVNYKVLAKQINSSLNNILGIKMVLEEDYFLYEHILKFVEEQKFFINVGVARCTKNNSPESGDCYSVLKLKNGQFALVLSDGMGSGNSARKESIATIELFEDFMEAGFDKNTAMKMINSVLTLKNSDDNFSTLDVCFIDLFNGSGEFIKIGAANSFLLRNNILQEIKSSSLPMGILNNIKYEFFDKKFLSGDIIIMATDGLFDTIADITDKKKWLLELILKLNSNNPQDIADFILNNIKLESKNFITDDITILVGRIWEKK